MFLRAGSWFGAMRCFGASLRRANGVSRNAGEYHYPSWSTHNATFGRDRGFAEIAVGVAVPKRYNRGVRRSQDVVANDCLILDTIKRLWVRINDPRRRVGRNARGCA